jgi:adhesin transport system outer membrane protein
MPALTPLWSSVLLALVCAQAQAMSLSEAIQSTIDTHPELQASINDRRSTLEQVKVAKGGYLPVVDAIAGYGREETDNPTTRGLTGHNKEQLTYGTSQLRLRQMIFDGFNTPNEVARTEAVVDSRAYYIQGTAEDLALRTIEVYLEVLKRREMVALAKNNLQAHQRMGDQIGLRSERGVGSAADTDQSAARVALAANNLYTEEVNLADAEANFFSAVGRMPDELETPASIKGQVPEDLASARQTVIDNNPLLKSAQSDVNAAEKQYEVAKSPFYPRLDAELAANANNNTAGDEGHDNSWRAGVVMTYNLFNGGRDKANLQSSAYKINQAMDIRNNALRVINENLSLAWNAMQNARLQTPKARDYADYTKRVRMAYQDQFGLGQRTLLDLLDSENELFTANRRYVEVRYTEEFSMYRLQSAMGDLLQKQGTVLPTEATALNDVKSTAQLPAMK